MVDKAKKPPGKAVAKAAEPKNPSQISMHRVPGMTEAEQIADSVIQPAIRNAAIARTFGERTLSSEADEADLDRCIKLVEQNCEAVRAGNLDGITDTLTAQIAALDALFTNAVTRAGRNMGTHPKAVELYMGIAFKAQAGCRTTAETLARIKRGGKQTVKVVHVYPGGQAVVADTVNNETGGRTGADDGTSEQAHEQYGEGAPVAALPRPDSAGDALLMSSLEGSEAMPIARRG